MVFFKDNSIDLGILLWEILDNLTSQYVDSDKIEYLYWKREDEKEGYHLFKPFPDKIIGSLVIESKALLFESPGKGESINLTPGCSEQDTSPFEELAGRLELVFSPQPEELPVTPAGFMAHLLVLLLRFCCDLALWIDIKPVYSPSDKEKPQLGKDPIISRYPFLSRISEVPENRFWSFRFLPQKEGVVGFQEKLILYDSTGRMILIQGGREESFLFGEVLSHPLWLRDNIAETLLERIKEFLIPQQNPAV